MQSIQQFFLSCSADHGPDRLLRVLGGLLWVGTRLVIVTNTHTLGATIRIYDNNNLKIEIIPFHSSNNIRALRSRYTVTTCCLTPVSTVAASDTVYQYLGHPVQGSIVERYSREVPSFVISISSTNHITAWNSNLTFHSIRKHKTMTENVRAGKVICQTAVQSSTRYTF